MFDRVLNTSLLVLDTKKSVRYLRFLVMRDSNLTLITVSQTNYCSNKLSLAYRLKSISAHKLREIITGFVRGYVLFIG